jgi:hypothetical protein
MKWNFCIALLLVFTAFNASSTGHLSNKKKQPGYYILPDTGKSVKDTSKVSSDTSLDDEDDVKHRKYEIGLEGANDQPNHGIRNKAGALPYLEPSFTYRAKSGFNIEVDDQFLLVKKNGGFDVFTLNPGWDFDLSDNTTINGNLTFNSYKKKTPNTLKSGLEWVPEAYIDQYIIGELEGKFTIDYDIYRRVSDTIPKTPNDIIFTPDLLYTFSWDFGKLKKCSVSVIPEASFEFGTRNFYTNYVNNTITDSTTNNIKKRSKYVSATSNSSFGAIDYNLMLSIELKLRQFSIEPELTYTRPLYSQPNVPSTPYAFGSITLTYTIKGKK